MRIAALRLERDAKGMLLAELHRNGGPLPFMEQDHTELADAF
jgi:hypothetical protein